MTVKSKQEQDREAADAKAKDDKHAPYATPEQGKLDPAAQATDLEIAQFRHTREGGPFADSRRDATESEEALAARRGKQAPRDQVLGGLTKYRCSVDCYRQGVLIPAGAVIAVPSDEEPSLTWEEVDDKTLVHFPFPKLPETEEQIRFKAKRKEAQERAAQRAARAAANNPAVLAQAYAAQAAAAAPKLPEKK